MAEYKNAETATMSKNEKNAAREEIRQILREDKIRELDTGERKIYITNILKELNIRNSNFYAFMGGHNAGVGTFKLKALLDALRKEASSD